MRTSAAGSRPITARSRSMFPESNRVASQKRNRQRTTMNDHAVRRRAWPLESPELGSGNVANPCIRFIIPFSILGIDSLIWSATGIPYLGSAILLIPAGLLFLYYWPYLIANWMVLFAVLPVVTYLVFATMYGIANSDGIEFMKAYFINGILITVIAGHIIRSSRNEIEDILYFSRNILFIFAISVIVAPYYYPYLIVQESYRSSGFFVTDPNAAAMLIAVFFNFLLYVPYTRNILNYLGILISITGILFTYSKAGIILFLASWVLYMMIRYKWYFVLSLMLFVPALGMLFWPIIDFWFENFVLVYMNESQILRIEKMLMFVHGNFSEQYAGYKSLLWPAALAVIQENFPHGAGLGAFHHLEGIVFSDADDNWFGVHNMYLMIHGEAGLFAFLLFIVCYGGLFLFAIFSLKSRLALSVIFITLLNYGTIHNGFGQRFQIAALAICIGLLGRKANNTPGP